MQQLAFISTAVSVRNSVFIGQGVSKRHGVCGRKRPRHSPARMTLSAPVETVPDTSETSLRRWYRRESPGRVAVNAAKKNFGPNARVTEESCFVVALSDSLSKDEESVLKWLFGETYEPQLLTSSSQLGDGKVVEVGPRLSFQTAWGANAVTVSRSCGVKSVQRIERFRRYKITGVAATDGDKIAAFERDVHDRMTEAVYDTPVNSLEVDAIPAPTVEVDVLRGGETALQEVSKLLGLGFDEQDIAYYLKLFRDDLARNPTDVELFDLAQSNSEHSRHWYFNARLVNDGIPADQTLMDIVRAPLRAVEQDNNSVIAFADNSSSIRGGEVAAIRPKTPGRPGALDVVDVDVDVLCTAETHNFPSGVAPFPGAETGTGGRIRDSAATGTGSLVGVATAGYSVGNLRIPGATQPWEDDDEKYPENLASPLKILIDASNGASDYGNKFGEPVISGFARTYGLRTPDGQRREYVKPIMFSGGLGQMMNMHARKGHAEQGLVVVKIGGPAYRIGLGGGAASSMTQGANRADLDFNAVQRGDAQMEQRAYRVIRACVELGGENPIVSLHDQGAGGNCNVVKELIYPEGARIHLRKIWIGDRTLSALEIWGAEYQEQFGLLLKPESVPLFRAICQREGTVATEIGRIDGSKRIVLWDEKQQRNVADMDLDKVLGKLPQKTFEDERVIPKLSPLELPANVTVADALARVLALPGVGSKRFLTTKVDRSVGGLVAQQQTVGPLQLPLANAGVMALSHFGLTGAATSLGERPGITALSPQAMARMSVAEMLTNLGSVKLSRRNDIKCEGNWMWAAKLPGDGAAMYDAAVAMRDVMIQTGIAVDGGKDSLSMAATCPPGELVRAPGTLVVTGYCTVPDITKKLTPDIKRPGTSTLVLVDISNGQRRTGGSALAQVYRQLGSAPPDVDDARQLRTMFDALQDLHDNPAVLSYHDVSDGGIIVAALEMAYAGRCGVELRIDSEKLGVDRMAALFAEEIGVLLEVEESAVEKVAQSIAAFGVTCSVLGRTMVDRNVTVFDGSELVFQESSASLHSAWERTAFALERLQAVESCVAAEENGLASRTGLSYVVPYTPLRTAPELMARSDKPRVAIVREEGSNGDREMAAAFHLAGFEAWDVSMSDLRTGRVTLDSFRGAAFVGGFSYADVLGSAKGWAGVVRYSETVRSEMERFYARDDTFSLGVCNGCQLMALLGVIPGGVESTAQPRFVTNNSGRYESRFLAVAIAESPAMMLRGMAGARLGVWVAHGEGRCYFPDSALRNQVSAPIRYVNDEGVTAMPEEYPHNPNGSTDGIAAICSDDGRHLAMMPHPERAVLPWQWAYAPDDGIGSDGVSPWLKMFQNAREWCDQK